MREYLGEVAASYSDARVTAELHADIVRVAAAERGESSEAIVAAEKAARKGSPVRLRITRRVRYWSDGAIIGSKLFVLAMTSELFGRSRAENKRLAATESADGMALFAFRCLRNPV